MTFIYEFDPYPLDIYRMFKSGFSRSRLSEVIVLQTYMHRDRQTDRQTDTTTPLGAWSINTAKRSIVLG